MRSSLCNSDCESNDCERYKPAAASQFAMEEVEDRAAAHSALSVAVLRHDLCGAAVSSCCNSDVWPRQSSG